MKEPSYVDRDGNAIDVLRWGELWQDMTYHVLRELVVTRPGDETIVVRLWWVGVNSPANDVQPFCSSMSYCGSNHRTVAQYATREEAERLHGELVTAFVAKLCDMLRFMNVYEATGAAN